MSLVVIDVTYLIIIAFLDDYAPKEEQDKEHSATRGVGFNFILILNTALNNAPRFIWHISIRIQEDYILNSYIYIKAEGKYEKVWKTVLYVYKALLQATACILAFWTRKVHIKVLNDAKYITAIIYTTSILLAISVIGVFMLSQYPNAFAAVFSTCLLIVSTLILALLFIPKVGKK